PPSETSRGGDLVPPALRRRRRVRWVGCDRAGVRPSCGAEVRAASALFGECHELGQPCTAGDDFVRRRAPRWFAVLARGCALCRPRDRDRAQGVSGDFLTVRDGQLAGSTLTVDGELRLGREASGLASLGGDPRLSRWHALITRDGDGALLIEDLR